MYAKVIIDIAHSQVDRLFTYAVPEGLRIQPGQRVRVPFGRGNRATEGFVLELAAEPPPNIAVKPLHAALEPYPALLPDQLALARWMQDAYHCLLVDALRLMIPPQMRGGRVRERLVANVALAPDTGLDAAIRALYTKNGTLRAPKQLEVLELFRMAPEGMPAQDITRAVPGAAPALRALLDKGLLVRTDHVSFRRPPGPGRVPGSAPLPLTPFQQRAHHEICSGMDAGQSKAYLLHGITGSGKTEVYLQAIAHGLASGKQSILLVPEIALTPQTVDRFRARFGERVAVLHSRLSPGERFDEWRRLRTGRADMAVGARSAVFAPLPNLGLIVIDEEHELSYQSEQHPAYHALEVAHKRCQLTGAALVLGSATPSIQSYFRAASGRYSLLELPERVEGAALPQAHIADMRAEFLAGNNGIFSGLLRERLADCVARGEQAILFLNRRGYSTFVSCRGCGHVFRCRDCDVPMTFHKTDHVLRCHYCKLEQGLPEYCPACGKRYIKYFGVGTQQVQEQARALIPGLRVARMDTDTTRSKGGHRRVLDSFVHGDAQVLVGTQMIAKGLDIPNVTLVGVVAADSSLHLPDFRAHERTFQLLTQVAGRAGRADQPGHVVIQTYSPEHPVIRFAAAQDYKSFYAYELSNRRAALFPPYALFVRLLLTGADATGLELLAAQLARLLAARFSDALQAGGKPQNQVLSLFHAPAPVKRRRGQFRHHILLKLLRTRDTAMLLREAYQFAAEHRDAGNLTLTVNPPDML